MIQKILFICTGNTCRSLMAEHLLKKMAKDDGIEIEVRSAGVSAGINSQIPALTLMVLGKEGISPDGHIVTPLTTTLIEWADLILAMETPHLNKVIDLVPEARDKVFLLTEYGIDKNHQVARAETVNANRFTVFRNERGLPDPFGGSREAYETCLAQIKECLGRLIEILKDKNR
ncbi:MAG: low molecular weight protein arginine phosphatase [bacterium]|nr:low molecular weight protein arginine phosphatase [bacterium]